MAEYWSALHHTRGVRLLDKMLEMSSSRKNIPEYVFLRSLGIIPEKRGIHSFHDLAEAFRQEEVDSADAERNYNREIHTWCWSPNTNALNAELMKAKAETDKQNAEKLEQTREQKEDMNRIDKQ